MAMELSRGISFDATFLDAEDLGAYFKLAEAQTMNEFRIAA